MTVEVTAQVTAEVTDETARVLRRAVRVLCMFALCLWTSQSTRAEAPIETPRTAPAILEAELWADPERIPELYRSLGTDLASAERAGGDQPSRDELLHYLMDVAEMRARRLASLTDSPDDALRLLAALLQIDPRRFHENPGFRRLVAGAWPSVDVGDLPGSFRLRLVERLAGLATDDFELLEPAAVAWGVARRDTAARRRSHLPPRPVVAGDETDTAAEAQELAPIAASFFSAPEFLGADAVARLVASVRSSAPERRILVLADDDTGRTVRKLLRDQGLGDVDVLPSLGIDYSPWPRDPMSWTWRPGAEREDDDYGLHVVLRGNVQRGREADQWMGRALIQGLPDDLDEAWGEPTWQRSEQPFHNGQILDAGGISWVGIHSLEPRILERTGFDRVPVERFAGPDGRAFVEAALDAADDLSKLRGRPVRFVHTLPKPNVPSPADEGPTRDSLLRSLGGGAGIDLDSVLTLLPQDGGGITALVADVDAGTEFLRSVPPEDLEALSEYGLAADASLRARLVAGQSSAAAAALDLFLERVAEHLMTLGMTVHRLPLLRIDDPSVVPSRATEPFLITWNNVVLEQKRGARVAEGFASLLPSADEASIRTFAAAGYELRLHPPMVESVLRNGGFRCASQHVRLPPRSETATGPEPVDTPPDGP